MRSFLGWFAIAMVLAAVVFSLCGCKTSTVTGGQSSRAIVTSKVTEPTGGTEKHRDSGVTITYHTRDGGTLTIDDRNHGGSSTQPAVKITETKSDATATTQPSVTTNGDSTNFKATDDGFSFQTKNVVKSPTAWALIGILALVGFLCYWFSAWGGVVVSAAGIVLAFVFPAALAWMALAAVGLVCYVYHNALWQLVQGGEKAQKVIPTTDADKVRTALETKQSPGVSGVVDAMRTKMKKNS